MIKLHILNSNMIIKAELEAKMRSVFEDAKNICQKLITLRDVDVIFYNQPNHTIKQIGIGGTTTNPYLIMIPVNIDHKITYQNLYLTLCHEFHHCMRQKRLKFPSTLLDAVVSEGLADQFEVEISPNVTPITFRDDIDKELITQGLISLKDQMSDKKYDYNSWFFGSGEYPNWFGYTLGNLVVEKHVQDNKKKPSKLVNLESKSFEEALISLIKMNS